MLRVILYHVQYSAGPQPGNSYTEQIPHVTGKNSRRFFPVAWLCEFPPPEARPEREIYIAPIALGFHPFIARIVSVFIPQPGISQTISVAGEITALAHALDVVQTACYWIPGKSRSPVRVFCPLYRCRLNLSTFTFNFIYLSC